MKDVIFVERIQYQPWVSPSAQPTLRGLWIESSMRTIIFVLLFGLLLPCMATTQSSVNEAEKPTWMHDFGLYVCKSRPELKTKEPVAIREIIGNKAYVNRLRESDLRFKISPEDIVSSACIRRLDSLPLLELKNPQFFELMLPSNSNEEDKILYEEAGPSVIDIYPDGRGRFFWPNNCDGTKFPLIALKFQGTFILMISAVRAEDGEILKIGSLVGNAEDGYKISPWSTPWGDRWVELSLQKRASMCQWH